MCDRHHPNPPLQVLAMKRKKSFLHFSEFLDHSMGEEEETVVRGRAGDSVRVGVRFEVRLGSG